jgi:molybdopterin-binding protein
MLSRDDKQVDAAEKSLHDLSCGFWLIAQELAKCLWPPSGPAERWPPLQVMPLITFESWNERRSALAWPGIFGYKFPESVTERGRGKESKAMEISARNQIGGTVAGITPGAVNGAVKVDIGGGNIVTASITEEAIADLGLAVGDKVTVIVKASDVMLGK